LAEKKIPLPGKKQIKPRQLKRMLDYKKKSKKIVLAGGVGGLFRPRPQKPIV
jgi:hypothetical protein